MLARSSLITKKTSFPILTRWGWHNLLICSPCSGEIRSQVARLSSDVDLAFNWHSINPDETQNLTSSAFQYWNGKAWTNTLAFYHRTDIHKDIYWWAEQHSWFPDRSRLHLHLCFVVSFYQISWAIVGVSNDTFIGLNVGPEHWYLTHEKCQ